MIYPMILTHWGRVTHICVSRLTITGSDNGLSLERRQAIIWTNAGILLIGPLGTNFSEILIEILIFSFKKMCLKVSSVKKRPFCLGPQCVKETTDFTDKRILHTWAGPDLDDTFPSYVWALSDTLYKSDFLSGILFVSQIESRFYTLAYMFIAVLPWANRSVGVGDHRRHTCQEHG